MSEMSPFDFVKDILNFKRDIMVDSESEKIYNPFLVNRSLSYHYDCLFLANEMNMRPNMDKRPQYVFLMNTVRSTKRPFMKWQKPETIEHIDVIRKYYNVSRSKAAEIYKLLSPEDIKELYELMDTGGTNGGK